MTVVASDSTTLIVLSDMNRFDLLGSIFAKVYIPQTVLAEISSKNNINLPDFIEIELPQDDDNLKAMKLLLDDGESEAIALALQKSIPLIIDEKKGRKIEHGAKNTRSRRYRLPQYHKRCFGHGRGKIVFRVGTQ